MTSGGGVAGGGGGGGGGGRWALTRQRRVEKLLDYPGQVEVHREVQPQAPSPLHRLVLHSRTMLQSPRARPRAPAGGCLGGRRRGGAREGLGVPRVAPARGPRGGGGGGGGGGGLLALLPRRPSLGPAAPPARPRPPPTSCSAWPEEESSRRERGEGAGGAGWRGGGWPPRKTSSAWRSACAWCAPRRPAPPRSAPLRPPSLSRRATAPCPPGGGAVLPPPRPRAAPPRADDAPASCGRALPCACTGCA